MKLSLLSDRLSPGTQLGEILFGLIMTLTFTLGAGAYFGGSEGATRELLYARSAATSPGASSTPH
jgi:hypothetical protein